MGNLSWYLPRKYVSPLAFKILVGCELPFTIAVLALFGIASPDLYRTRLWQDGADNGFNSSPDRMVYELANYRPYEIPDVWDEFITSFNLVISVLSTFFLLVKTPMFLLNVFYPPLSIVVHSGLIALYCVSAAYQAGKDVSDPEHPQPGPPWYITKDCNVAHDASNVGYCQQAKSGFACTIVLIAIFTAQLILAILSCLPTAEIRKKQHDRRERHEALEELKSLKSPIYGTYGLQTQTQTQAQQIMTPRTGAFNQLNGTSHAPVMMPRSQSQSHETSPNSTPDLKDAEADGDGDEIEVVQPVPVSQQQQQESQYAPDLQHLRLSEQQVHQFHQFQQQQQQQVPQPTMYFPPPPKKGKKGRK